jgi:hypothetical protein
MYLFVEGVKSLVKVVQANGVSAIQDEVGAAPHSGGGNLQSGQAADCESSAQLSRASPSRCPLAVSKPQKEV